MFGIVTRVKAVKTRTQSLVQLNLELAKLEGKQKGTAVGIAGGLAAVAGVLLVYAIGFGFAAIAAGLSEALSLWLSLLIVAGLLVLLARADVPFGVFLACGALAAFVAGRSLWEAVAGGLPWIPRLLP